MNKQTAIIQAIDALEAGMVAWGKQIGSVRLNGKPWLDDEDREALADGAQWPAMLADYRDRLGVPVSAINAARDSLLWLYDEFACELIEQCDELNAQIAALPESDRDSYATLSGRLEDTEQALFDLNDMRNDSLNDKG